MKIGNVTLCGDAVLAPLAGFSDVGFRAVCAEMGAALTYTEMVSAKGLVYGSDKTLELLYTTDAESVKAVQLFGGDPDFVAKAVEHPALAKFDIIDINMGCPVPKIVNNGEGSALLSDEPRAAAIVRAAKDAAHGRAVTVKIRLGIDDGHIVAPHFAAAMQTAGADAVTVHGRTRKQLYGGRADRTAIAEVVKAVSIPVIANGDVAAEWDYREMKAATGAAGVMAARGALGNPNLFARISGRPPKPKAELIKEHIDVMLAHHCERFVLSNMRKHFGYYFAGKTGNKAAKAAAFAAESTDELKRLAQDFLGGDF